MPRVPQLTEPGQSLRPVDSRGLNFRAQATDFGMGDAVQGVGRVSADVVEQQQRENRKTLLEEFGTAAYQWETQNIQGDALQKRGKDSLGISQTYTNSYDEWLGEYTSALPEDDRELVRLAADSRRAQIERTLVQHSSREWEAYQEETATAYQSSEMDAAITYYDDPERVGQARANLKASIKANARGEAPEVTQRKLDLADSGVTHGVIKQMVANGQVADARRYMEKNGDQLVGEDATTAEAMLKDAEVRLASQMQTDDIVARYDNESDALKAARGIDDPEIRDNTVTRVKQRYAEKRAAEERQREESWKGAQQVVDQTGDISGIDPEVWSRLSNSQQSALETRARQVREKQINGMEPVTNRVAYSKWVAMAAESPEEFAKMDPYEVFRPHTSDADYRALVGLHSSIVNGKADDSLPTSNTISFNTRVMNTAQRAGIIPVNSKAADWNDEQAQRYQRFMEAASLEIEDQERKLDRKLTTNEQQAAINELMVRQVFVNEFGTDPQLPAAALSVDELGKAYVPYADIPEAERAEIEGIIQQAGLSAEKELVQRLAAAYAAGDQLLFTQILSGEL